jgi:hypothetical protein
MTKHSHCHKKKKCKCKCRCKQKTIPTNLCMTGYWKVESICSDVVNEDGIGSFAEYPYDDFFYIRVDKCGNIYAFHEASHGSPAVKYQGTFESKNSFFLRSCENAAWEELDYMVIKNNHLLEWTGILKYKPDYYSAAGTCKGKLIKISDEIPNEIVPYLRGCGDC